MENLTKSPLGSMIDISAASLNLYNYGRKPFIFFAFGIVATSFLLSQLLTFKFVRGVSPTNPEWKEALSQLQTRIFFLYRNLIYSGSFVIGVSQAVKKQENVFAPNLGPVILYGKLLVILFALEFVCNILLQAKSKKGAETAGRPFLNSGLTWFRDICRETAEQMISGIGVGFGYGYMIRGVGVLFKAY
jgi:hypothetical protein